MSPQSMSWISSEASTPRSQAEEALPSEPGSFEIDAAVEAQPIAIVGLGKVFPTNLGMAY